MKKNGGAVSEREAAPFGYPPRERWSCLDEARSARIRVRYPLLPGFCYLAVCVSGSGPTRAKACT